jgi:hypothetical protein
MQWLSWCAQLGREMGDQGLKPAAKGGVGRDSSFICLAQCRNCAIDRAKYIYYPTPRRYIRREDNSLTIDHQRVFDLSWTYTKETGLIILLTYNRAGASHARRALAL